MEKMNNQKERGGLSKNKFPSAIWHIALVVTYMHNNALITRERFFFGLSGKGGNKKEGEIDCKVDYDYPVLGLRVLFDRSTYLLVFSFKHLHLYNLQKSK